MDGLQELANRIPEFLTLAQQPGRLAPYLAYYFEELHEGAVVTPKVLGDLYEQLRVRPPANLSDVLRKSKAFVRPKGGGYRLSLRGYQSVRAALLPIPDATEAAASPLSETQSGPPPPSVAEADPKTPRTQDPRAVFVVYGRDERLRKKIFAFLRAIGLHPLEFNEVAQLTGSTSPFILDVLNTGFSQTKACVVLLTPDEEVSLRPSLRRADDPDHPELQPRPNVLIEAGMALALQPERTILLQVGKVRQFSDLGGKHYINLTGTPTSRHNLAEKLRLAGCDVKTTGEDWMGGGRFKPTK